MILTVAATAGTKTKNIMNNDLQRVNNRIKQLEKNNSHLRRNIKMYEIKVGKLRHELSKAINDADAASRGYNINNERL